MRVLIIFAIFAVARGAPQNELLNSPDALRILEESINSTIECVKDLMNTGDASIGLPSFNPLVLNDATFNLDNLGSELISGQVTLNNLVLNGVTSWATNHLKVSVTIIPIGAKAEIKMEWVGGDLVGDYNGDINILGHNLKGSGHIVGSLATLGIDIKLHGTLSRIGLKNFSIKPSLGDMKLKIDGIYLDGEDKSEFLSEAFSNGAAWVNENRDEIDAKISQIIMSIINQKVENEKSIIGDLLNKCAASY